MSSTTKEHKEVPELVCLLQDRGMHITDTERAVKKLSQVGYYRLSGFWYPCRRPSTDAQGNYLRDPQTRIPLRDNNFQENTHFSDIFSLYLFDKKLRLLLLDAIERIEIQVRSVIAHEMGKIDPLAYQSSAFFRPRAVRDGWWAKWQKRADKCLRQNGREDFVRWHTAHDNPLPFWAVVECWDYGVMSTYFANLKPSYQVKICEKIGFPNAQTFVNWLREINTIRNKAAHHARVWNYTASNPIKLEGTEDIEFFESFVFTETSRKKLYSHITVIWFLVRNIGPNSTWIQDVADLVDNKPQIDSCPFTAMGFPDNSGFPRHLFGIPYSPPSTPTE